MKAKLVTLILLLTFCINTFSQLNLVTGNVYSNSVISNDEVWVSFTRVAPASLEYETYTNADGAYSIDVEDGIYNISFGKNGCLTSTLENVNIYNDTTIQDIFLEVAGLMGSLKDTIYSGEYIVDGDIEVLEGDTLVIEIGTTFLFKQGVEFIVNGLLIADGISTRKITFTRFDEETTWGGIKINSQANPNSILNKIIVEYASNTGLFIESVENIRITNSVFRHNTSENYGGGISCISPKNLTIEACQFINNQSNNGGGAIQANMTESDSINIYNSLIHENFCESTSSGSGGIYFTGTGGDIPPKICIENSVISKNQNSGIRSQYFFSLSVVNSNIISNIGDGISYDTWNLDNDAVWNITNSIVAFNTGKGLNLANNNNVMFCDFYENEIMDCENCSDLFQNIVTVNNNNHPCDGFYNIFEDPLFSDTVGNSCDLNPESPCIDAGVNDSLSLIFDFNHNYRIINGNNHETSYVDIGAIEFSTNTFIEDENITDEPTIEAYPNPMGDYIYVNSKYIDKSSTISIMDMSGKVLISKPFSDKVDVSSLKNGLYILKVKSQSKTNYVKLVKN